jgi:hypothetical protein
MPRTRRLGVDVIDGKQVSPVFPLVAQVVQPGLDRPGSRLRPTDPLSLRPPYHPARDAVQRRQAAHAERLGLEDDGSRIPVWRRRGAATRRRRDAGTDARGYERRAGPPTPRYYGLYA